MSFAARERMGLGAMICLAGAFFGGAVITERQEQNAARNAPLCRDSEVLGLLDPATGTFAHEGTFTPFVASEFSPTKIRSKVEMAGGVGNTGIATQTVFEVEPTPGARFFIHRRDGGRADYSSTKRFEASVRYLRTGEDGTVHLEAKTLKAY